MYNPKISIVIPLYNYEKYIGECLKSCIKQTYANVEILVIDDCSTDSSVDTVEMYVKKDNRVKLFQHKKNKGYSVAKNTGIQNSTGEYIVHLDADDMLTPNSIVCRLNAFEDDPTSDFVHGRCFHFSGAESYEWCNANTSKLKCGTPVIHAQGVMLKRKCYEKYGLYETRLRSKSDKEMWVRLRDIAKIKIKKIDEPVAFYRIHDDSMMAMRRSNKSYQNEVLRIFAEVTKQRKKEGITRENTLFMS